MKRLVLPFITASALIFGVILPEEAVAQTTAKDLIGTWTLVCITLEQDGKKTVFMVKAQGSHLKIQVVRFKS
jgi:hypothetical protein